MIERHEVLCPPFIECDICNFKRYEITKNKVLDFFDFNYNEELISKHLYFLKISITPSRETYQYFSLEPLKKSGRELINGLSSLSSVSNRRWWSMFVDAGLRFYSVEQPNEDLYPTFAHNFIFYSDKDNLDIRMNTQLKYRLKKISRSLSYSFDYIGKYNLGCIEKFIPAQIAIDCNTLKIKKLGTEIIEEIYKIKAQRPIIYGRKRKKLVSNNLLVTGIE
jgi:hypothetical protein